MDNNLKEEIVKGLNEGESISDYPHLPKELLTETLTMFIEQDKLPDKAFRGKNKLANYFPYSQEVNVKPLKLVVKAIENPLENLLAIMKPIVIMDELRVRLNGVHFDRKHKKTVATDGNVLVMVSNPYIEKTRTINPHNNKIINGKYPNYRAVIPKTKEVISKNINNIQSLLDQLNGLAKSESFFNAPIHARIRVNEVDYIFNPILFLKALKAVIQLGATKITLELESPTRALVIKAPSIKALVMPVFVNATPGSNDCFGFKTLQID